jgi:hypothetical protein
MLGHLWYITQRLTSGWMILAIFLTYKGFYHFATTYEWLYCSSFYPLLTWNSPRGCSSRIVKPITSHHITSIQPARRAARQTDIHPSVRPSIQPAIQFSGTEHETSFPTILLLLLAYPLSGNLFTEPLPNNGRLLSLPYTGLQASCHNNIFLLMSKSYQMVPSFQVSRLNFSYNTSSYDQIQLSGWPPRCHTCVSIAYALNMRPIPLHSWLTTSVQNATTSSRILPAAHDGTSGGDIQYYCPWQDNLTCSPRNMNPRWTYNDFVKYFNGWLCVRRCKGGGMEWRFYYTARNLHCSIKERSLKPREKNTH